VKLWIEIKMNRDAINCFGSQESEAVDCWEGFGLDHKETKLWIFEKLWIGLQELKLWIFEKLWIGSQENEAVDFWEALD
jgi:hypothetical protein